MHKIREVLRLGLGCSLGVRRIEAALGVGKSTAGDYLKEARELGLTWPLPEGMTDRQLEQLLRPPASPPPPSDSARPLPAWSEIHREMRKPSVTLALLWEEYKAEHPEGYQYSQFCEHYRRWKAAVDVTMRQSHRAGEKMFVDYAGMTVPIHDRRTGKVREASIFVAVLGASSYTFALATESEDLPSWIDANVRALEFFGGAAEIIVPDNLKAGVNKPCRYEAEVNRTYQDMAAHYGAVIIPARVRKPRDKAKAEVGVQVVERWILAALRKRTFFSIGELNGAIGELLERLNTRPFRKMEGSRRSLFESIDRPALRPLPQTRYEFAQWKSARVNIDYHIEIDAHRYSVPYHLAKKQIDVRFTKTTIECFFDHRRVASHRRNYVRGGFTTDPSHMPESHRRHQEWTPSRIIRWAAETGPSTAELVETIMASRPHPEQGFRSCLGIIRLEKPYGAERVEAAARRALDIGAPSYSSVKHILKNNLDRQPPLAPTPPPPPIRHGNLRGPDYYSTEKGDFRTC